jgi:hypothetical protein
MFTSTTMTRTHDDEKRRTHGTTILKWCFSHSMVRSAASFFLYSPFKSKPFSMSQRESFSKISLSWRLRSCWFFEVDWNRIFVGAAMAAYSAIVYDHQTGIVSWHDERAGRMQCRKLTQSNHSFPKDEFSYRRWTCPRFPKDIIERFDWERERQLATCSRDRTTRQIDDAFFFTVFQGFSVGYISRDITRTPICSCPRFSAQ